MSGCFYNVGFIMIAVFAIASLFTISGAGIRSNDMPLVEVVAFCINVCIFVSITTITRMGCISLLGTSRGCYYRGVTVTGCFLGLSFIVIAFVAITSFSACGGTGGGSNCIPVAKAVSGCVNIFVLVRITAIASVSSVSLSGTSWISYNRGIAMSFCINIFLRGRIC